MAILIHCESGSGSVLFVRRRTQLADARGNRVTFQFDRLGQDLGSTDPLDRRVTFGYDPAGNKTRKLDPRHHGLRGTPWDKAHDYFGHRGRLRGGGDG